MPVGRSSYTSSADLGDDSYSAADRTRSRRFLHRRDTAVVECTGCRQVQSQYPGSGLRSEFQHESRWNSSRADGRRRRGGDLGLFGCLPDYYDRSPRYDGSGCGNNGTLISWIFPCATAIRTSAAIIPTCLVNSSIFFLFPPLQPTTGCIFYR